MSEKNTQNSNTKTDPLNVFLYDDYRTFLLDFYEQKKKENPKIISHRYLSRRAGFSTSGFFHRVMAGKRNLTLESARKIASVIPLQGRPLKYFEALIQFNQAKTDVAKQEGFETLKQFREYLAVRLLRQDQLILLLKWYYTVIFEMIRWPNFKPDPQWIVRKIRPYILADQAREALEVLVKLDLVKVCENGRWVQDCSRLSTKEQGLGREVYAYHAQALSLSQKNLSLPKEDRNYNIKLMSASPAHFELVRKMMWRFHKEIDEVLTKKLDSQYLQEQGLDNALINTPGFTTTSEVVQLNMQLFKVAKSRGHNE